MTSLYTESPKNVPQTLTKPTTSFKRKVFIAIAGLLLFVFTYLGLMIWFGWSSYHLFASLGAHNESPIKTFLIAFCIGVLAIFMFKSLFILNKKNPHKFRELKAEEHPVLFDFVYRLADEAKAPRPHKIIVSPHVNASVFYDLSIWNLLFPSKKNLEIGLGLVNVLNLGEFKAVLAHEFGHFAQRSMLLGRYVYIAHQIASRIVGKRDALDAFLRGLSSVDIRIAWIGWILSILVWAIRSLVEVLFSVVVVAERALSREMEFQADLVAVSLTGSDALINGLHKLRAADEAYRASIESLENCLRDKEKIPNLYILQNRYLEGMRTVLNDPSFGADPEGFIEGVNAKVFKTKGINPPEMWATHPADEDREANAKAIYIPSTTDKRPTWALFHEPVNLQEAVTNDIYNTVERMPDCETLTEVESITRLNTQIFNWSFLDPEYNGLYAGHHLTLFVDDVDELYTARISGDLRAAYEKLYPESLQENIDRLKQLNLEKIQFEAVKKEVLTAERRVIFYRGKKIKRSQIPQVLQEIEAEIKEIENSLHEHDKLCRTVNEKAALSKGKAYADYHRKVLEVLHYAEHNHHKLNDSYAKFVNAFHVAVAGGRASSDQIRQLVRQANRLGSVLERIYDQSQEVVTTSLKSEAFDKKPYADYFEPYRLGDADEQNINEWTQNVDGWMNLAQTALWQLRNISLERLLTFEAEIKTAYLGEGELSFYGLSISVPRNYTPLVKGTEEKFDYSLSFWDRFLAGDGLIPKIAKFSISAAMIVGVIIVSGSGYAEYDLYLYNGLDTDVQVSVNNENFIIGPFDYARTEVDYGEHYRIETSTLKDEKIEFFEVDIEERSPAFVYNVAYAAFLMEYTVSYGYDQQMEPTLIGAERWLTTNADHVFTQAPESVYTSGNYETRRVLEPLIYTHPYSLPFQPHDKHPGDMVLNHIKWDDQHSKFLLGWLQLGLVYDTTLNFIDERLKRNPGETATLRLAQDVRLGADKEEHCKKINAMYKKDTENPDLYYLHIRCLPDSEEQDKLFVDGHKKWPNNGWLAYAAAFSSADEEKWDTTYYRYQTAISSCTELNEYVGMDAERIRRMASATNDQAFPINDIPSSTSRDYMIELEKGSNEKVQLAWDQAYFHLANADYTMAQEAIDLYEDHHIDVFNYYLAASVDAPQAVVDTVLSWDESRGIDANSIWVAIALRAKNDRDYKAFFPSLESIWGERLNLGQLTNFIEHVRKKNVVKSQSVFNTQEDYRIKTSMALIGAILLESNTPDRWMKYVDNLLFINEKPCLKRTVSGTSSLQ